MARRGDFQSRPFHGRNPNENISGWTDYFDLHMEKDRKTEMYVKLAKVMLIYQGPKAASRNDAISKLCEKFKYAIRILSDETYRNENCCAFDPQNTTAFFDYLKCASKKACQEGSNLIVIDQSVTSKYQIDYYFFLAQNYQYVILVLPPIVSSTRTWGEFRSDKTKSQAKTLIECGSHVADIECNYFTHKFCGWFLHEADSESLRSESALYMQDCLENIPQFAKLYEKVCDITNFKDYFNLDDRKQDLAYCPVKIFYDTSSMINYFNKKCVQQFYGKMSKLVIVGFIVSPYMIAARIKLSASQKFLWDMPNDLDEECQGNADEKCCPSKLMQETKVKHNEELKSIACKSNPTLVNYNDPLHDPIESVLEIKKGKSCHIVLGKAPKASARNIDYGVPFAVHRENKILTENPDALDDVIDNGRSLVLRIGKYWFIYLKQQLVVDGFFATCSKAESFGHYE